MDIKSSEIKDEKKQENDVENNKSKFKTNFFNNIKKIKKPELILAVIVIAVVIIAYILYSSGNILNTSSQNTSSTDTESRLEEILSNINGVGKVKVMIYYENTLNNSKDSSISFNSSYFSSSKNYEIKGVLVVAEGADNMDVKVQILRAVEILLSINADCIEIFTMNN